MTADAMENGNESLDSTQMHAKVISCYSINVAYSLNFATAFN